MCSKYTKILRTGFSTPIPMQQWHPKWHLWGSSQKWSLRTHFHPRPEEEVCCFYHGECTADISLVQINGWWKSEMMQVNKLYYKSRHDAVYKDVNKSVVSRPSHLCVVKNVLFFSAYYCTPLWLSPHLSTFLTKTSSCGKC